MSGFPVKARAFRCGILVYNYGIAIHDLVFAANLLARAETPDTPYRCCREKYFIRCF